MKLICDCGNECEFNTKDKDGNENKVIEVYGQFATIEGMNIGIDSCEQLVSITCERCGKSIFI